MLKSAADSRMVLQDCGDFLRGRQPDESAEAGSSLLTQENPVEQREDIPGLIVVSAAEVVNLPLDSFGRGVRIRGEPIDQSAQLRPL